MLKKRKVSWYVMYNLELEIRPFGVSFKGRFGALKMIFRQWIVINKTENYFSLQDDKY